MKTIYQTPSMSRGRAAQYSFALAAFLGSAILPPSVPTAIDCVPVRCSFGGIVRAPFDALVRAPASARVAEVAP